MNQHFLVLCFLFETTYSHRPPPTSACAPPLASIPDPTVEQPPEKMGNYQNHQLELLDHICISCKMSIAPDEF